MAIRRSRNGEDEVSLTEGQRAYFLSWLSGMALGLPRGSVYGSAHPFAGHSKAEVEAAWRANRDELLTEYEPSHDRPPWPDFEFGIVEVTS